jgi:hypothetical protein
VEAVFQHKPLAGLMLKEDSRDVPAEDNQHLASAKQVYSSQESPKDLSVAVKAD